LHSDENEIDHFPREDERTINRPLAHKKLSRLKNETYENDGDSIGRLV
jgi:hypothetical protein